MGKNKPKWPEKGEVYESGDDPTDDVRQWFGKYFCGCGSPELAIATLIEVLDLYQQRGDVSTPMVDLDKLKAFDTKYSEGMTMLMLYFMDGTGLTEHGGSVYGAWLTNLGVNLKKFLEVNPDYEP